MGTKSGSFMSSDSGKSAAGPAHPIWRGIGLVMFILAPIMGYFGALILLAENQAKRWIPLPVDLIVPGRDPLLLIKIILTLGIMFLLISIFQFIAFLLFRIYAPPVHGPTDIPRSSLRVRRKVR